MQAEYERKDWAIVYPVYINAKKTAAEGRRIAKNKAVDNPSLNELADVCKFLKLECQIETDKAYPRDWMQKGRLRVKLKEGKPLNPEVPNRHQLLLKMAELIPRLQSRQTKTSQPASSPSGKTQNPGGRKNRRR